MGTFAQNLARIMQEKQLTQVELAKRSGVTRQLIGNYLWESKRAKYPSLTTLLKLARALNCTLEELTGLEAARGAEQKIAEDPAVTAEAQRIAEVFDSLPEDDWRKKAMREFIAAEKKRRGIDSDIEVTDHTKQEDEADSPK